MSTNDASHDISHIHRVLGLSHKIYSSLPSPQRQTLDLNTITLCALLDDVGDRKYLTPGIDPSTQISTLLLSLGAEKELAEKIQTICSAVSYSAESKDLEKVQKLIEKYPELAIVQDGDRLDSIGAVGIGRLFTYGGARTSRGLSVGIMDEKLFKLEGLMKTEPGKELARERTRRLREWKGW